MDNMKYPYPLTIVMDRYNGAYSGGKFIAWNEDYENINYDAHSGDVEASSFWINNTKVCGKGDSPKEAIADLIKNMETPTNPRKILKICQAK